MTIKMNKCYLKNRETRYKFPLSVSFSVFNQDIDSVCYRAAYVIWQPAALSY